MYENYIFMHTLKPLIGAIMLAAAIAGLTFGTSTIHAQSLDIPDWVKNNALWWAEGGITDQDFVNALQFLINEGIITIPGAATEAVKKEPSVDLPYDIDIKFEQARYGSGDMAKIQIETDSPDPENVRLGVFDSAGNIIYETTAKTNDFGTAGVEFRLAEYYQKDEQLEAVSFFERDTKDKYTASTLVEGVRITEVELDIDTQKVLSNVPATVKVSLSDAVSKEIGIRVIDSDKNVLYDDTITTNDFGTGTAKFTAPVYYLEDELLEITASFADEPSAERKIMATVGFTKAGLTITSDKNAYAAGDRITITVMTDPPISTDIKISASGESTCLWDITGSRLGSPTVQTDANGMATITGEIGKIIDGRDGFCIGHGSYPERYYWGEEGHSISVYTSDKRFELTDRLIVLPKR